MITQTKEATSVERRPESSYRRKEMTLKAGVTETG